MHTEPSDSADTVSDLCPGLRLDDDGIWRAPLREQLSYPEHGHRSLVGVEDDSFWFQHRNRCITSMVRRFPPQGMGPLLDIGGGNGVVSKALQDAGFPTILLEPGPDGARNARNRGIKHVAESTLDAAGAKENSLPGVGMFDVLEHIADDERFLIRLRELLRPKARLYISAPSHQWLWSHEDEEAGHFRRYTLGGLDRLASRSGLKMEYATYFFWPLPLPIALFRCLPYRLSSIFGGSIRRRSIEQDHASDGASAQMLLRLLRFEVDRVAQGKRIPFGASCLAVLVKK